MALCFKVGKTFTVLTPQKSFCVKLLNTWTVRVQFGTMVLSASIC